MKLFCFKKMQIYFSDGTKINYELLIVAAGLEIRFDMVLNSVEYYC